MKKSSSADQHRTDAPQRIRCAVITVSDTRTVETDTGGAAVVEHLKSAGHEIVAREILPDDPDELRKLLNALSADIRIDAVLMTGGTGITSRDQTFETVDDLLTRRLPGYGELFRQLSFAEIGPAAMLSRAQGGLIGATVVLTMPGSPAAVRLAMERIILPELGHLVREAVR